MDDTQVNSDHVEVRYRGVDHRAEAGVTVEAFVGDVDAEIPDTVLSAVVNRRQVMLDFPLRGSVELDLVRFGDREGESVYKRSVSLMFYEACRLVYPDVRPAIGQSLGNCYHYQLRGPHPALEGMAAGIERAMLEIHSQRRRFVRHTATIEEVESYFRERGFEDKLLLLATRRSSTANTITCGDFVDLAHGPYAPHTGCLPTFGVMPYGDGLVLRFPRRSDRGKLPEFTPRDLLFKTYTETRRWEELLGIHHVGQLNRLCLNGDIGRIVRVAEGLHEKRIAGIADDILSRKPPVRVVMVAGPSASGKTTFTRRLGVQLRVNGIEPVALSLDDYYVNRDKTPRGEDGRPDFEALDAIDLELFHTQLPQILEGCEVKTPRFDFVGGARVEVGGWRTVRLAENQVLVVEGLHGLNERLTDGVTAGRVYRVYVSSLSQLAIDDHNRIFTADGRLIRRIVRDRLFRGFSTERTLDLWDRVRAGEGRWIFPYQERADVMFNSALVYEPAVLKTHAERFLLQVPRSSKAYTEAFRLLKFLSMFVPIYPDEVPQTSILREFIGGGAFSD